MVNLIVLGKVWGRGGRFISFIEPFGNDDRVITGEEECNERFNEYCGEYREGYDRVIEIGLFIDLFNNINLGVNDVVIIIILNIITILNITLFIIK
jgi:hypothetical protein